MRGLLLLQVFLKVTEVEVGSIAIAFGKKLPSFADVLRSTAFQVMSALTRFTNVFLVHDYTSLSYRRVIHIYLAIL